MHCTGDGDHARKDRGRESASSFLRSQRDRSRPPDGEHQNKGSLIARGREKERDREQGESRESRERKRAGRIEWQRENQRTICIERGKRHEIDREPAQTTLTHTHREREQIHLLSQKAQRNIYIYREKMYLSSHLVSWHCFGGGERGSRKTIGLSLSAFSPVEKRVQKVSHRSKGKERPTAPTLAEERATSTEYVRTHARACTEGRKQSRRTGRPTLHAGGHTNG